MADLDRFEARLAASLQRLAGEVPTSVDAVTLTASIAAAEAARDRPWLSWRSRGLAPALRLALVVAVLFALLYALAVLAPRPAPTRVDRPIGGLITCEGETWLGRPAVPTTLGCASELGGPPLDGRARLTLAAAAGEPGRQTRSGTIELLAGETRWTGTVRVTVGPGMAVGDADLEEAGGTGRAFRIHLISGDGLVWGVVGSGSEAK